MSDEGGRESPHVVNPCLLSFLLCYNVIMKKTAILILSIFLFLGVPLEFSSAKVLPDFDKDGLSDREEKTVYKTNPEKVDTDGDGFDDLMEIEKGFSPLKKGAALGFVDLDVPYTNEAPDDNWTGPWKNACEESTLAMVEKYYLGQTTMTKTEAKAFMQKLFDKQDEIYGSNADSDAERNKYLIDNFSSYGAVIKNNPTIQDIKNEINGRRPVITMHHGFSLGNKNIPFRATGSSFHVLVVVGYDDSQKQFIVNDPGDRKDGKNHRYDYDLFMNSLHDFNFKEKKANGPARVVFTFPKLVKISSSSRVFYFDGQKYYYITSPSAFVSRRWSWAAVNVVSDRWLSGFSIGENITK